MPEFVQFLISGLTVGAVYALVALGFTLVYNASDVVNFAQGEFVMLGGMVTVFLSAAGIPLPLAAVLAVCVSIVVGLLLYWLAIEPARDASPVALIIITIGASILLRGAAQIIFDKQFHKLPSISGDTPVILLYVFLERAVLGKAVLATAANRLAARLVGINTATVMALAFGGSAAIGAVAGILITPITLTSYDVGTMLALKGFAAAMLGGMGNPIGAVAGGLLLGLLEAFGVGYISSTYKDAFAFIVILLVLFAMPQGLFGRRTVERV
ncbi:MAG: branched-chain amino acid ABC transporter permease [Afipia sp.]|nr:branched-chain amino acid ABC transporter permease [Afipia sp.]